MILPTTVCAMRLHSHGLHLLQGQWYVCNLQAIPRCDARISCVLKNHDKLNFSTINTKRQGSGKSYTMNHLASKGLFPLQAYVIVDPDEIRSHFPEYHWYATHSPPRAGELTQKEAGYVAELVTAAALQRGYNVLVDGSLRDAEWYQEYFQSLRKEYDALRIAILHITAPRDVAFERVAVSNEQSHFVL
mmetsp:Transcript_10334/g.19023  ORF Transcript_10334/g.19023 Transcript_10334/m.19023 type:complete len:189 (+) Transcript_10334:552-1118(+)